MKIGSKFQKELTFFFKRQPLKLHKGTIKEFSLDFRTKIRLERTKMKNVKYEKLDQKNILENTRFLD